MAEISRATLQAVTTAGAALGISGCGYAGGDREQAFAFIDAGAGEIQLCEDGQAWWRRCDQTHAVADERELEPPATQDPAELARWMASQARQFDEP